MSPPLRTSILGLFTAIALVAPSAGAAPDEPAPAQGRGPAGPPAGPEGDPLYVAGGLTADTVGTRAVATSYSAKASVEALRAAAARVDQAWVGFVPRLTGLARYTRLSSFTPPAVFDTQGVNFVGTRALPGQPIDPTKVFPVPLSQGGFPIVVDNYTLQATITVPVSDYFLRIDQAHTAATHATEAARQDVVAVRAKALTDGKLAYYTWMRARGALVVAKQALADQVTHLTDAKNLFTAGRTSKADVLRAETGVAGAELTVERTRNLVELSEKQIRLAMHAPDTETLVPGEPLEAPLPPMTTALKDLEAEASSSRPELKGIDANVEAVRQQVKIAKALYLPQVGVVGNAILANPNPRRFPQKEEFFPTWDVSAQLSWSPNDALLAGPAADEPGARLAQIEAQRGQLRDGISLEIMQAHQAIREADASIAATAKQLASATEAYRVARELFNAGVVTSTTLTDAETELWRSRLEALNAMVDARVARVRLDHAVGRDVAKLPGG